MTATVPVTVTPSYLKSFLKPYRCDSVRLRYGTRYGHARDHGYTRYHSTRPQSQHFFYSESNFERKELTIFKNGSWMLGFYIPLISRHSIILAVSKKMRKNSLSLLKNIKSLNRNLDKDARLLSWRPIKLWKFGFRSFLAYLWFHCRYLFGTRLLFWCCNSCIMFPKSWWRRLCTHTSTWWSNAKSEFPGSSVDSCKWHWHWKVSPRNLDLPQSTLTLNRNETHSSPWERSAQSCSCSQWPWHRDHVTLTLTLSSRAGRMVSTGWPRSSLTSLSLLLDCQESTDRNHDRTWIRYDLRQAKNTQKRSEAEVKSNLTKSGF